MSIDLPTLEVRSGDGVVFYDPINDDHSCSYEFVELIPDYHSATFLSEGVNNDICVAHNGWKDLQPPDCPPLTASVAVHFIIALLKSAIRFRRRTVLDLTILSAVLSAGRPIGTMSAQQVSHLFSRLLLLIPVRLECLFHSFFLLHFLAEYGIKADWVFGVRLFPFSAHCWIADGSQLLNEASHAIEDYRIIYVSGQSDR